MYLLLFKEMLFESTLFYYKKQIIKSVEKNTFVKLQPIGRKQIVTLAGRKDECEGRRGHEIFHCQCEGIKKMLYTLRGYSKQNLSFFLLSSDCEIILYCFFFLLNYNYDVLFLFNELAFLRAVM